MKSGIPLNYAYAVNKTNSSGTLTDEKGFFCLQSKKGKNIFIFSYIGYKSDTIDIDVKKDTFLLINLRPDIELKEVVVHPFDMEEEHFRGRKIIRIENIKNLPSIGGERDILKLLIIYPGISEGKEGFSSITVRGGGTDQNLFMLDGTMIYNSGHLYNFVSVFNTDAIKNIEFYKNGFPARFGGNLSSVSDIILKDGNNKKMRGILDIGIINSKIMLDGPLGKTGKTTFLLAARSTYLDLFQIGQEKKYSYPQDWNYNQNSFSGYTFADINLKLTHIFNDKNQISLFFYSGIDYSRLINVSGTSREYNKYNILNNVVSLQYSHKFNPKSSIELIIGYMKNSAVNNSDNDYYKKEVIKIAPHKYKDIWKWSSNEKSQQTEALEESSSKINYKYYLGNSHLIRLGLETKRSIYKPVVYFYASIDTLSNKAETLNLDEKNWKVYNYAAYAEDEIRYKYLLINVGCRWTAFRSDNLFTGLEPRISIGIKPNNTGTFNLSYSKMVQPNHALFNNEQVISRLAWVPSNKSLSPQVADQYSFGYAKNIKKYKINFTADLFFKSMGHLSNYRYTYNAPYVYYKWDSLISKEGKGKSYGMEIFLEKSSQKLNFTASYTLAWSYRKFNDINYGEWFPYIFDKRHVLALSAEYLINEWWKISGIWSFNSGNRINFPSGYVFSNPFSSSYFIYDGINQGKLPDYHRLDLGLEWKKVTKKQREFSVRFNVYNAYNHKNSLYIYIDKSNPYGGPVDGKVKSFSYFPVLPSMNFSYKF